MKCFELRSFNIWIGEGIKQRLKTLIEFLIVGLTKIECFGRR